MKLILAIVQDKDATGLAHKFVDNDIRATKLATSGSFLRSGNTTFIIGVEDDKVQKVLDLIKESCHTREQMIAPDVVGMTMMGVSMLDKAVQVTVGGATVFVLNVENFARF